jgi:PAS domain S-box-containing protein
MRLRKSHSADDRDAASSPARPAAAGDGADASTTFDALARVAARLLDAPIALIWLFEDDGPRLRSTVGLPESLLAESSPANSPAPCERITKGEAFLQRDAVVAPPFKDSAVAGTEIRSYATVPFAGPSGLVAGALCVADKTPRDWADADLSVLADVARGLEAKLAAETHLARAERTARALQDNEEKATEILERMDEGFYALDRDWRITHVNRSAEHFWGMKRRRLVGRSMFELFPRFQGSQSHAAHERVMRTQKLVRIRTVSTATGRPVELHIFPSAGGVAVYFRDVSAEEAIEAELRNRGEALTLAEESAGIGIWDMELGTGMVRGTPQFFNMMGLPAAETIPIEEIRGVRHPADRASIVDGFDAAVASGASTYDSEYRIVRNGEVRWIFGRGRVARDGAGKPVRYSGIDIDITERKRTEEALRRNDERLRIALTAARMFVWEQNVETGAIVMSENVGAILGTSEPFVGRMNPKDRKKFEAAIERTRDKGEPCDGEYRFRRSQEDGWLWLNLKAVRVEDGETRQQRLVGVAVDVTERVRQFRALRESEARFRTTADSAPVFIWMTDEKADLTFLNRPFAEFLGTEAGLVGAPLPQLLHADEAADIRRVLKNAISRGKAFSLQSRLRRHDGEWRWFRSEALPRLDEAGTLLGFTGCSVDVTEARAAEEFLRSTNVSLREQVKLEAEEKLRALKDRERFWELSQDLFAVLSNVDGKPRIINARAWENTLGYPAAELMQTRFISLIHPDDLERTMAAAEALRKGDVIFGLENRYRRPDGTWRWLSWNVINEADLSYAVARDVTDERAREETYRRAQKLEALGQLTGGVAHDFNNLLMVIIGSLDLFQKRHLQGRVDRLIGAALSAARKGERLNRQLLGFARRQAVRQEYIVPGAVIDEMRPLIQGALRETIDLQIHADATAAGCLADAAQLEAAVLNLVVNARDAMSGRGRVTIDVRDASSAEIQAAGLGEQRYLAIDVTDTGAGMSADVLSHAFEPFFTTKAVGQGTGLGLAQVYGFAQQFKGSVEIRSTLGRGTTVTIYLPAAEPPSAGRTSPSEREHASGSARILLVEDDPLGGAVMEDMLVELGHKVTRFANADEAETVLARGGFDLLITDVRMPGRLNGVDLARVASRHHSPMKVLLCSGWTAEALGLELSDSAWPILPKPFTVDQLAQAIETCLAGEAAPADAG